MGGKILGYKNLQPPHLHLFALLLINLVLMLGENKRWLSLLGVAPEKFPSLYDPNWLILHYHIAYMHFMASRIYEQKEIKSLFRRFLGVSLHLELKRNWTFQ